jgi:hypothetical protein
MGSIEFDRINLFSSVQVKAKVRENVSEIPKYTLMFREKEIESFLVVLRTQGGQRRYTVEHIFLSLKRSKS